MKDPVKKQGYNRPKHTLHTIKKLFSYMKKYRSLWPVIFIAVLVSSGAGVAGSYIIKPALNDFIIPFIGQKNPDTFPFLLMLLKMLCLYAVGAFATWLNARIMLKVSTDVLYRIRIDLFKQLETLPIKYHDANPHGQIMSRFTNDIDTLRDMLSQSVPQFMSSSITIVSVFIMMLILNPLLTMLVVCSISLIIFTATHIGKKSAAAFREQQKNIGAINAYIEELISGVRVVKVFNYEDDAISKFALLNEALRKSGTRANSLANILMPLMGNLSHLQYVLVAIAGAVLIIHGKMDVGTIAAFLQYTRSFSHPVTMMSQQFNGILNALAGAERIFEIINEESEIDNGEVRLVYAYEANDKSAKNNKRLVQSYAFTGEWGWRIPTSA
ncbi:MAG: ABC transporter ATP-binding protein, partial [Treponema sp.]|nr:ABC transporter ATP-binding protein [Treponema sp.]